MHRIPFISVTKVFIFLIILVPVLTFAQARDTTTRPKGVVTLEEFTQAISDESRIIYVRTVSDSLAGPIIRYESSKFYLEDSTSIDHSLVKSITEHWTYSNRGAMYGAIGGALIGGITVAAIILSKKSETTNPESNLGFLGPALIVSASALSAIPGSIIGSIIGSKFERGYNFPVTSLESE
jgi:hypothetical protein